MISDEERTLIRRLFFAEHWKIGTIAAELGLHHDTVELAVEPRRFIRRGLVSSVSLLEPYQASIGQTLEQYPRLRAFTVLPGEQAQVVGSGKSAPGFPETLAPVGSIGKALPCTSAGAA